MPSSTLESGTANAGTKTPFQTRDDASKSCVSNCPCRLMRSSTLESLRNNPEQSGGPATPTRTRNGRLIHETRDPHPVGTSMASLCPGSAVASAHWFDEQKPISAPRSMNTMLRGANMANKSPTNEPTTSPIVGVSMVGSRGVLWTCPLDGPRHPGRCAVRVPLCLRADGTVEPVEGGQGALHGARRRDRGGTLDIIFATPDPIRTVRGARGQRSLDAGSEDGNDARGTHLHGIGRLGVRAARCKVDRTETIVRAIVYPTTNGGSWDVPTRRNA